MDVARRVYTELSARKHGIRLSRQADSIHVRRGNDEIRVGRDHEVYTHDMVVFFDYYFSAVVPEPDGARRVADYSKPKVHRLSKSGVELEFPSLPESDESTNMYLDALKVKAGEVVFDLGAYAGGSTYFFSRLVGPTGLAAAFEPDPTTLRFLRSNVQRHALENVQIFDCGIWSENTTLSFQSEGNMGSSVSTILQRDTNLQQTRVITLDEAARLVGDRRIDCIKMDIEGAEVEVLKSAGDFMRRNRPRIVIEPHRVNGTMTTDEISQILRALGYHVEVLSQGSQDWPLVSGQPG